LRIDDLLALLGNAQVGSNPDRGEAIACYLSGSEGWTEAVQRLGGAFAAEGTKLREGKAD
jgi:hypothetical protein